MTVRRILSCTESDGDGVARAVATLVIEQDDDGSNARVVDVRLQSLDGRALRSADMLILEGLGLPLPVRETLPALAPTPVDPPATVTGPPVPAAKPAPSRPKVKATRAGVRKGAVANRPYRPCPPLGELDETFREHGGSPSALAEHYKVPRHTVQGWLHRHRAAGHVFPDTQPTMQADAVVVG